VSLISDPTVGGQVRQGRHGEEDGERCGYRAPFMKASWSVCPGVRTSSGRGKRLRSKQHSGRVCGVGARVVVVVVVRCAEVVTGDLNYSLMERHHLISAKLFHPTLRPAPHQLSSASDSSLTHSHPARTGLATQDSELTSPTRYSPLHFPTLQPSTKHSHTHSSHIMGTKRSRQDSVSSEDSSTPFSREQSADVKVAHLDTESAVSDHPIVMRCSLPPHEPLAFDSFDAYDVHYQKTHMNRCSECQKNFPDEHFLHLHIAENHDPINASKRDKGEKTVGVV
jgi:hypothetical protein